MIDATAAPALEYSHGRRSQIITIETGLAFGLMFLWRISERLAFLKDGSKVRMTD